MKKCFLLFSLLFAFSISFTQDFTLIDSAIIENDWQPQDAHFIDYDNDNDLDILFTGFGFQLYENDDLGNFGLIYFEEIYDFRDASVGDYNGDGFIDIFAVGTYKSQIYRNDSGTFVLSDAYIPGIEECKGDWADYDNDGDLDVVISGFMLSESDYGTWIYENKGSEQFVKKDFNLKGGMDIHIEWIDYQNDGDMDLWITGLNPDPEDDNPFFYIYKNENGDFTRVIENFTNTTIFSSAFGDYDNDGDFDLILSGAKPVGQGGWMPETQIFKNNGSYLFTEIENDIIEIGHFSSLAWGDVDNDGDLDILISGNTVEDSIVTQLYINNGDDEFVKHDFSFEGNYYGPILFGDYDNDSDLDILVTGWNYGVVSKLYENQCVQENSQPTPPSNIYSSFFGQSFQLLWDKGDDTETSKNSLTYNISIVKDGINIISPLANINTGYRKVPDYGNVLFDTLWNFTSSGGEFQWCVQSIDNSFIGSEFTESQTFSVPNSASGVSYDSIAENVYKIEWIKGDGAKSAVFIKMGELDFAQPENYISYEANATYGQGDEIGNTGWYCVYNDEGNEVTVAGFEDNMIYSVMVIDYVFDENGEVYFVQPSIDNPIELKTKSYFDNIAFELLDFNASDLIWGDYDSDEDLDLFVFGNQNSKYEWKTMLFKNNNGNLEEIEYDFIDFGFGKAEWCDIDSDNDLDIIISGIYEYNSYKTLVYLNIGNDIFEEASIELLNDKIGTISLGDFDNDGDQDLLFSEYLYFDLDQTYLFINDKGTFNYSDLSDEFYKNTCYFSDLDNDGYIDVLQSGYYDLHIFKNVNGDSFEKISYLEFYPGEGLFDFEYQIIDINSDGFKDFIVGDEFSNTYVILNEEEFGFQFLSHNLDKLFSPNFYFGDFNTDGYLDLISNGYDRDYTHPLLSIYQNTNGVDFIKSFSEIIEYAGGAGEWSDFDNDNDLDFTISGYKGGNPYYGLEVYENSIEIKNTKPSIPENLISSVNGNSVTLEWDYSFDNETPQKAITYNVYIAKYLIDTFRVSPQANLETGYRHVLRDGNCGSNEFYKIKISEIGDYYWSVQAIDNSYSASEFAAQQTFQVTSINEIMQSTMHVFPNPCNDVLHIKIPKSQYFNKNLYQIFIYNSQFNKFPVNITEFSTGSLQLDVSKLITGLYIIELRVSENTFYNKFIKM